MKKYRAAVAAVLCIALTLGVLSLSSFASLMPFVPVAAEPVILSDGAEESPGQATQTSSIVNKTVFATEVDALSGAAAPTPSDDMSGNSPARTCENTVVTEEPGTVIRNTMESASAGEPAAEVPEETESEKASEESVCEPITEAEPKRSAENGVAVKAAGTRSESDASDIPSIFNRDITGVLISSADVKSYSFTVTERGVLQFSFTHEKSSFDGVWNVSLYQKYNDNGYDGAEKWRLLHSLDTSASKITEKSPHIGLHKGVYRIAVTAGENYSSAAFLLNAAFTPGTDYEIEYNDSVYRYTEIMPGIPIKGSSGNLKDAYDADYYMFRLASQGTATLTFEHTPVDSVSVYWRIALYDENGKELYADNSLSTSKKTVSGKIGLVPGCYYIGIFSRVYCDFDYTLTVGTEKRNDFETEFNGSTQTADLLWLNNSINGALTSASGDADIDIFSLTVSEPGIIRFTFTTASGSEEDYCWHMLFTDRNGNKLSESRAAPASPEVTTPYIGVGTGTYYVTVDNRSLHKNNSAYTVSCEYTVSADWEKEYNGSPAYAVPIAAGVPVNGTLVNGEADFDDDFYKVTLTSAGIINVSLEHEQLSGERYIYSLALMNTSGEKLQLFDERRGTKLVDENGAPVLLAKSYENTPHVSAGYLLPAGTYYIRVTSGLYAADQIYSIAYTVKQGG